MKKLTKSEKIRRLNIEIFFVRKKRAEFAKTIRKLEKELETLIEKEVKIKFVK